MKIPDTLFEMPVSLSPRLAWMRQHEVTTHYHKPGMFGDDEGWSAFIGSWDEITGNCVEMEEQGRLCYGHSEQEAVERLAKGQGWRLWNESL